MSLYETYGSVNTCKIIHDSPGSKEFPCEENVGILDFSVVWQGLDSDTFHPNHGHQGLTWLSLLPFF